MPPVQVPVGQSPAARLPLQRRPTARLLELDAGGSGRRGPSVPVPPGRPDPGLPGAAGKRRRTSPGLQAGKRRGPGGLSGLAGGFRLADSIGPVQRWRASLDRAPGSGGQPGQRGEPGAGRAPGRHRAAGLRDLPYLSRPRRPTCPLSCLPGGALHRPRQELELSGKGPGRPRSGPGLLFLHHPASRRDRSDAPLRLRRGQGRRGRPGSPHPSTSAISTAPATAVEAGETAA